MRIPVRYESPAEPFDNWSDDQKDALMRDIVRGKPDPPPLRAQLDKMKRARYSEPARALGLWMLTCSFCLGILACQIGHAFMFLWQISHHGAP